MVSTLSVGDEVIISEPAWPAYRDCANFIGVKVKAVKTKVHQNWDLDLRSIRTDDNSKYQDDSFKLSQ